QGLGNALGTLELDLGPHLFEGSLDPLGLFSRHALLDVLWRILDEILRLFQPESRDDSDFPDDLDLHLANGLENDRELGLFLRLRAVGSVFSDSRRADILTLLKPIIVPFHKWRPTALMLDEVFQGAHDVPLGQRPACRIFVPLPIAQAIGDDGNVLSPDQAVEDKTG